MYTGVLKLRRTASAPGEPATPTSTARTPRPTPPPHKNRKIKTPNPKPKQKQTATKTPLTKNNPKEKIPQNLALSKPLRFFALSNTLQGKHNNITPNTARQPTR
jgi:outer membrane biosynthesis protein TonB